MFVMLLFLLAIQLFERVEVDKPAASRSASAEIFLVALKYKAPAKIDPRLLDVRHLFQGSVEPQKKVVFLFCTLSFRLVGFMIDCFLTMGIVDVGG